MKTKYKTVSFNNQKQVEIMEKKGWKIQAYDWDKIHLIKKTT